jgi:hypothetical protein
MYPKYQFNLKPLSEDSRKRIIDVYLNQIEKCNGCGNCQSCIYKYIVNYLKKKKYVRYTNKGEKKQLPRLEDMKSFGYSYLQGLIQSLIISFPYPEYENVIRNIPKIDYNAISNSVPMDDNSDNNDDNNDDENMDENSDEEIDNTNQIYNNKGGSSADVVMDSDISKDVEDNIDVDLDTINENIVSPDDLFGKKRIIKSSQIRRNRKTTV